MNNEKLLEFEWNVVNWVVEFVFFCFLFFIEDNSERCIIWEFLKNMSQIMINYTLKRKYDASISRLTNDYFLFLISFNKCSGLCWHFQNKTKLFCFEKTTAEFPKSTISLRRTILILGFILRKRTFSHLKHLETSVLLDLRPFLLLY